MAFVEGDRVKTKQNAPIKAMYKNKEGVIISWHLDDIYTVEINGVRLTIYEDEMEKI
jgi:hypothetical protein